MLLAPCSLLLALCSSVASPYAPQKVGTSSGGSQIGLYGYDAASNRLTNKPTGSLPDQTITMGLLTKPSTITTDGVGKAEQFLYKPGGSRYLRVHADGRKTLYVNGMEYRLWGNTPQSIVQIHAKGYSPDVQVDVSDANSPQYTHLLKDHLGSPLRQVDDAGNAQDSLRYDPWGREVAATGVADAFDDAESAEDVRGYTGHELIASANMGHWNGRVFDYGGTGGFVGPDKFIQGRSIAALNRFALGHNNNPNVTDPSGWVKTHFTPTPRPSHVTESRAWERGELSNDLGDVYVPRSKQAQGARRLGWLAKEQEKVNARSVFPQDYTSQGHCPSCVANTFVSGMRFIGHPEAENISRKALSGMLHELSGGFGEGRNYEEVLQAYNRIFSNSNFVIKFINYMNFVGEGKQFKSISHLLSHISEAGNFGIGIGIGTGQRDNPSFIIRSRRQHGAIVSRSLHSIFIGDYNIYKDSFMVLDSSYREQEAFDHDWNYMSSSSLEHHIAHDGILIFGKRADFEAKLPDFY